MLIRVVDSEVFGHPIVEVLSLDGLLMLSQPVLGMLLVWQTLQVMWYWALEQVLLAPSSF